MSLDVEIRDGWLVQYDQASGEEEVAIEWERVYALRRVKEGSGRVLCYADVDGDNTGLYFDAPVAKIRSLLIEARERTFGES